MHRPNTDYRRARKQPSAPTDGQQNRPPYTIAVESNLVVLDVLVTDEDGNVLAGLKKENFRVLDEGKPQVITSFGPTDDPITIVMVLEYSGLAYNYFATRGHIGVRDFSIISMRKIGSR